MTPSDCAVRLLSAESLRLTSTRNWISVHEVSHIVSEAVLRILRTSGVRHHCTPLLVDMSSPHFCTVAAFQTVVTRAVSAHRPVHRTFPHTTWVMRHTVHRQTKQGRGEQTLLVMLRIPLPTVLRLLPVKLLLEECWRAAPLLSASRVSLIYAASFANCTTH